MTLFLCMREYSDVREVVRICSSETEAQTWLNAQDGRGWYYWIESDVDISNDTITHLYLNMMEAL